MLQSHFTASHFFFLDIDRRRSQLCTIGFTAKGFIRLQRIACLIWLTLAGLIALSLPARAQGIELLNISYDPTRELYKDINTAFAANWKNRTGQAVKIRMSHGGSGRQARAVVDGLEGDVVTLALGYDIDKIAAAKLMPQNWQQRLPFNSTPYYSTIVLMVRKGNPKNIRDWKDLARPGIKVITPNPKTSGGARWNYLAAYGYALRQPGGSPQRAAQFVTAIFRNVPVLDGGARAATTTFAQRGIGDVLITWENEAWLAKNALGRDRFEIIMPSISVLAEPPVAIVDANVDRHKTRPLAEAYLKFLYTPQAQEMIARKYYRPQLRNVAARYGHIFPSIRLLTIDRDFGGWAVAQKLHFDDNGLFDKIYAAAKR
jgi:sulfate/thiosulfate transport system substrate-binding protein